ncbi:MAG: bifunctional UDP-N-acetylglucosamine diphosphorylase/glucosamine-1-phosphate N-acetyltransferase GlmU [Thermodesulfovibrionales bacterium]|nr:bifunctional UDP-N-acetylglucosamine diphosphorylase/glucosamine-1-phosphate N-acetyltransferase GlmU [Thermodesulfovibrionales bacterium]
MNLNIIILAAGLGTRMKSDLPKILHPLCGIPMIQYIIETAKKLNPEEIVTVINRNHADVRDFLKEMSSIAIQEKPLGTADALKAGIKHVKKDLPVMVINGDTPLVKEETLKNLYRIHKKDRNSLSLLSFLSKEPLFYGRIIRDKEGNVIAIRETVDATQAEKEINEVNSGIYIIEPEVLGLINLIKKNKNKKEYFLTDLISISARKGLKVRAYAIAEEEELLGINTRKELSIASAIMRRRINEGHMLEGVTIINPENTYIERDVKIGRDTVIYPGVHIEGKSIIGRGCTIYQNVRISNSILGDNVIIKDSSIIEDSLINEGCQIGPFAHLRPGSKIERNVRIGNFVEVKKSIIGEGTKAMHLSYIGDAEIGKNVNVGAGTITCNYDGFKKHKTIIEDNVFIGSDSQLVAPVRIRRGAYIGAGSTITKDVPEDSLAISRTQQKHIPDWAKKHREKAGKD